MTNDTAQISNIEKMKISAVDQFKSVLPNLRTCEAIAGRFNLETLIETSFQAPALFIGVLKSPIKIGANEQHSLLADCAAYIVTDGKAPDRDKKAWIIAEAIAQTLASSSSWKPKDIGAATKIVIEPVLSAKINRKNITLIAVTWDCEIKRIGTNIFEDDGTVFTDLYVNNDLVIKGDEVSS